MKTFIGFVIFVTEVLFFQDISSAPTTGNTVSINEGITKLQAADSGLSKGDSASFSSSLHITHDPSSNSFQTIDTGAAEVIVATDNVAEKGADTDNASPNKESSMAVGSSVKLDATVETDKGFSNSVSLTGDALSGSGTGQSVSVGSGPLVTHHEHDSFDTKADLKNVETLKTVETSGGSSENLQEKSPDTTGTETLKEADTSNIGENATVEIQVVETLKTVEEKAIEKKLLDLGITTQKPTLPPSIEIIPDDAKSISPEFLDASVPLERLELPKPLKMAKIAAPKPFLDTSIHARKRITPEVAPIQPLTSTKSPKTQETTPHPLEGKITLDFKATDLPLISTDTPLVTTDTSIPGTDSSLPVTESQLVTEPPLVVPDSPVVTDLPLAFPDLSAVTEPPVVIPDPPVVTQPPLVVTNPPVDTSPKMIVTDLPMVATQPLVVVSDLPLVATNPPLVTTVSPLVVSDLPVVATKPPLDAIEPPLVATKPQLVINEPPLAATERTLINNLSLINPSLIKPLRSELQHQNASVSDKTVVTDIQPNTDSSKKSLATNISTNVNKIAEIDPLIESILNNPNINIKFDNANPVSDPKSHDSITLTKTDISVKSSSVQYLNNTSSNTSITKTNMSISVHPSVDSMTNKSITSGLNADQVLDTNAFISTDQITKISSPTNNKTDIKFEKIQSSANSDVKLNIDNILDTNQLTGTNNFFGTDGPMNLKTFLRSLGTRNHSNMVIYADETTGIDNLPYTDTRVQMDVNVFPRADLIADTVIGSEMDSTKNKDPSPAISDKNIYTLPLANQLDKTLSLDNSFVNKNNFADTMEPLNQEGLKSKSAPSEVNNLSQGTFTVSTGFTESPLISTTMTDSSFAVNTFNGDKFVDQSMNNFFTEDSKTRRNTFFTGQSKSDLLDTPSSALDWFSFLNLAPPPSRKSSEFTRDTVTEHDPNFGTSFRNNFFDSRTTTLEPEFQGKFQPCMMKKHTDPSKFYSSGIEMSCPPLLIWKQNKCHCDYPGPDDQALTIPSPEDTGTCDFLLKLDMENTYQNKYPQFKVDTRSRRRRITFENVKGSKGLAAHIIRSPLLVNAFQGNDLTATMHIRFKFRIANTRLNSRRLMILVSNGCGSSWSGPQPPSIALKFIPRNSTFKLVFRTDGKSVVEFLQPTINPYDGWYHVALYLQDQWLTLEINKEKLYSSNGMKGSVIITPCPLKITGRTFEGYIDEFEVAKKCRYKSV